MDWISQNSDIIQHSSFIERKNENTISRPLTLLESKQLIIKTVEKSRWQYEAILLLWNIIDDLLSETEFSDSFFLKFDYYSKEYTSLFYNREEIVFENDLEHRFSIMFSKLNSQFQVRNFDEW